jgi:hypothetical protein
VVVVVAVAGIMVDSCFVGMVQRWCAFSRS